MEPKIKPCPFCGNEAVAFKEELYCDTKWRVGCNGNDCPIESCMTVIHQLRTDAIKTWNIRATNKEQ
jgi:hypothetical protein